MEQHLTAHDHDNTDATDIFGFWIYILSDCIVFAALFAVFAVLRNNLYGQVDILKFTNLSSILLETLALLTSSFSFGLSIIALSKGKLTSIIRWLLFTFVLGSIFIWMEVSEFIHLSQEGFGWQSSAAMSAFFTLVGTHGLHVSIGLIWILAIIFQLNKFGINDAMKRRLTYLGLFWAFLDIIWIFVFTIVYLFGAI